MSSSVRGAGGELTMYLKHCVTVSTLQQPRRFGGTHLKTLVELLLLLVYYSETEINLVSLVEVGLHLHHLGEGLLRML